MKTVLLLRHAKAVRGGPGTDDHDRALEPRGEADARRIGAWLGAAGLVPQLVLCSTSLRTTQTLAQVMSMLARELDVRYEPGLYLAGAGALLARLRALPADLTSVMMVGHNPGMEQLALGLAHDGHDRLFSRMSEKFPTAALAHLRCEAESWAKIASGTGDLVDFVVPRELD